MKKANKEKRIVRSLLVMVLSAVIFLCGIFIYIGAEKAEGASTESVSVEKGGTTTLSGQKCELSQSAALPLNTPTALTTGDPAIATVTATATATSVESTATKATALSTYNGSTVKLADCLYTFTANTDGTYVIKSASVSGVYLNIKTAARLPNQTTSDNTTIVNGLTDTGSFSFKSSSSSFLYFHKNSGYYFNRNSVQTQNLTDFFIYRPIASGENSSTELPGYVKVTSLAAITSGSNYLIVAKQNNASYYYLLYPSTGADYTQAVKATGTEIDTQTINFTFSGLTEGTTTATIGDYTFNINVSADYDVKEKTYSDTTKDVYVKKGKARKLYDMTGSYPITTDPDESIAQAVTERSSYSFTDALSRLGNTSDYNQQKIYTSDCLFTFNKLGKSGRYYISSTAEDGTRVYLNPGDNAGCATSASASATEIAAISGASGSFTLYGDSNSKYLTFVPSTAVTNPLTFSESTTVDTVNGAFSIFKFANGGTGSGEIPGYTKITDISSISDGDECFVTYYDTSNARYYLLYPSTSTSTTSFGRRQHVAGMTSDTAFHTKGTTEVTITGVSEGITTVKAGHTTYNVHVVNGSNAVTINNTPFKGTSAVSLGSSLPGASTAISALTISEGATFALSASGTSVTWYSADESIAVVSNAGKVTGVSAGQTLIIANIDGTEYLFKVTVLEGTGTRLYNVYVSGSDHTTAYYSMNGDTALTKFAVGEEFYVWRSSSVADELAVFAAPDAGYALVSMSATGSSGNYRALSNGAFYSEINSIGFLTSTQINAIISAAEGLGCDGGMQFSRGIGNTNSVTGLFSFKSIKTASLSTAIAYVYHQDGQNAWTRTAYVDGDTTVSEGDIVLFSASTVPQTDTSYTITYVSGALTSNLAGSVFLADTSDLSAGTISALDTASLSNTASVSSAALNTATPYYVYYKVRSADVGTTISDTVGLTYTYTTTYSSGTGDISDTSTSSVPVAKQVNSLPSVGGPGTDFITAAGALIMACSIVIFVVYEKKKNNN